MMHLISCENHAPVVHCCRAGALFLFKRVWFAALFVILGILLSCVSFEDKLQDISGPIDDLDGFEEEASSGMLFTLYSSDGKPREELFDEACVSQHAIAYVSAHAVSEAKAKELLERFEEQIYPVLPMEEGQRIMILLTHMDGQTYGYAPFPEPEQGPAVCLNSLYSEDLVYALAHEYQHLRVHAACIGGGTTLSKKTDELLSDAFCETLFPGQGRERGILSEQRSETVRKRMSAWKNDAVSYAHQLLREGYSEEEVLLMMENR